MSLACGSCKSRHDTVEQARFCSMRAKLPTKPVNKRSGMALGHGKPLQTLGSFMRMSEQPSHPVPQKRIETEDERVARIVAKGDTRFDPNVPAPKASSPVLDKLRKQHAKRPIHPVTAAIRRGEITTIEQARAAYEAHNAKEQQ